MTRAIASKSRIERFLEKYFSGESIDYHRIFAIFLPVLIDQAFLTCMNLLNTAMISSSGVAAVSAVSMVDSLNLFLVNVFVAVSTGGTVVVAQYKGNGNDRMTSKAASGSVSSVFLLALTIGLLVTVFHRPTLSLLFGRAPADVFNNARIYLIGSGASYCGIATEEAVCGALRGVGETRFSLALSIIMNVTYVLLNLLLINTLHMGVLGMVISMNISRYFAAACAIVFMISQHTPLRIYLTDLIHFNLSMLKRIFYIGLPFAAEQMFFNGGKILTQTFIVTMGTFAMATNAICNSLAMVYQIPANALSLTTVTVVGQCMGRRDIRDARKFVHSFIGLSAFSFVVMGALVFPFFHPLVSLFSPPAQIVPVVFHILVVNLVAQVLLWSIGFITPSALRAAGDSKYTSVAAMLSMWLVRVVLGYVLGVSFRLGIAGVWLAMNIEWGVRGLIFLLRFHGRQWYKHHLID